MLFITSLIITITMLAEKIYFYRLENEYATSVVARSEIVIYILILLFGFITFVISKSRISQLFDGNKKINFLILIFGMASLFFIFSSFYFNSHKRTIHWDAVALYDARAKFLANGMRFSEMPSLAKYDNLNKYYYLLYPPYTSIAHFVWETNNLTQGLHVSVYYSFILVLLALLIFLISSKDFGLLAGTMLTFLVVSNSSIFNVVIKEYTNLPFDLYLVGGILMLSQFIKEKKNWNYLMGVLMVGSSMWIRLLEPIWLAVLISFLIATFSKKHIFKWCVYGLILAIFCLLEYYSWNYFVGRIANNPGFLNFTKLNILDTFVGVFTGAPVVVAVQIAKSWGIPLGIHTLALIAMLTNFKHILKNKNILFLGLVIVFSILIYFIEFYALSFQFDWWSIVTMSIDRSATFLIPISCFVLFDLALSILKKRLRLNRFK